MRGQKKIPGDLRRSVLSVRGSGRQIGAALHFPSLYHKERENAR